MRFDYYSATFHGVTIDKMAPTLLAAYDLTDIGPLKPKNGYTQGAQLLRGEDQLLRIYWGGVNGDDVHIDASGRNTDEFAVFARTHYKCDHAVSRADVAIDFIEPGAWDRISSRAIKFAKKHKLSTKVHGDWIEGKAGRTLEIGSRTSVAFVRIYEKGKQTKTDPDWVRVEGEFKPAKSMAKFQLAHLSEQDCWGQAKWTVAFLADLLKLNVARCPVRSPYVPTDLDRTKAYVFGQFKKMFVHIAEQADWDPETLGKLVLAHMEEFDPANQVLPAPSPAPSFILSPVINRPAINEELAIA